MNERLRLVLPHCLMLAVSVLLYWAAGQIDASASAGGRRLGPDFWPKLIIVLMGLLCVYEIAKRLVIGTTFTARGLTEGLDEAPDVAGAQADAEPPAREYPGKLAAGMATVVGFVLLTPVLGFFLAATLFLGGFAWIGGFRHRVLLPVISLAGALTLIVIFMRVAYVSLPLGVGPFRSMSLALLQLIGVN
jgi:putative tricarboxylic transport membrane protein